MSDDKFEREYAELERQHAAGEISYDDWAAKGADVVARHQEACPHPNPYLDGSTYVCDDCGAGLVPNLGGAVVVKSGCVVVAVALLGGVAAATYGVVEAVRHLA